MSGGAIFIISIPTEQLEQKLSNKPRKLFDKRWSVDTNDGSSERLFAEYDTFSNV